MFAEELLVPLRDVDRLAGVREGVDQREKVLSILEAIERRPLRTADASLIKVTLLEYIRKMNLENDTKLVTLINQRFSFEYLPLVSSLGIENGVKGKSSLGLDEINIKVTQKDEWRKAGPAITPLDFVAGPRYYLCSVRRIQTPLSTTYRMYLDGTKDFDTNGSLVNCAMKEGSILLLAAKKFKAGSPSQCYIWHHADSKLWKEKSAVGKLTRLPNNIYCGVPLATSTGDNIEALKDSGEISPINSPVSNRDEREDGEFIAQAVATSTSSPKLSRKWSFRQQSTTGSNNMVSDGSVAGLLPDGGIAFSMSSTQSMEKLIHFTGVAVRSAGNTNSADAGGGTEAGSTSTVGANNLVESSSAVEEGGSKSWHSEQALVERLNSLLNKELTQQHADAQALTLLRSKMPRKVPSAGGKTLHTVAFSKDSRVRAASRKNLVVDTVAASDALATATEWTTESAVPPLLQVSYRASFSCSFFRGVFFLFLFCFYFLAISNADGFLCSWGNLTRGYSVWIFTI